MFAKTILPGRQGPASADNSDWKNRIKFFDSTWKRGFWGSCTSSPMHLVFTAEYCIPPMSSLPAAEQLNIPSSPMRRVLPY
ncbi:hypothetical protein PoMZ_05989, partial [Pyricularia oryzae]